MGLFCFVFACGDARKQRRRRMFLRNGKAGGGEKRRQLFFLINRWKSNPFDQVKCTKMRKFGNRHRATFGLGKLSKVCTQSRASFSPRALRRLDSGHETVQTLGRSIALRNCVVSDDDDAIGTVLFQTKITQTILNSNKKHKKRSERKCWPSTAEHRTV